MPSHPTPTNNKIDIGRILGNSKPMKKLTKLIEKVGPQDTTVLIQGETGTGKELVARSIHIHSPRKNKPFIALNCSAYPDNLIESELFGHEKGAFTGADQKKKGWFELAHKGTLFLDEIGEIPIRSQVKLLRAIQERAFNRLGGEESVRVDIRILSATNRDLSKAIAEMKFREDLYFRLNVFPITVPALRERRGDIPILVDHFIHNFSANNKKIISGITGNAMETIMNHSFPGNVRELENIIQRAIVMTDSDVITVNDLPIEILPHMNVQTRECIRYDVKHKKLKDALNQVEIRTDNGKIKSWKDSLRSVKIEMIHRFLLNHGRSAFSRKEFHDYLNSNDNSNLISYKAVGDYLSILKTNRICIHNEKKANQSGYALNKGFLKIE